jgi:hypothetical protein
LDNYIGGEEYEEVLVFYPSDSGFRRWTMWRSHGALDSLSPYNSRRNARS